MAESNGLFRSGSVGHEGQKTLILKLKSNTLPTRNANASIINSNDGYQFISMTIRSIEGQAIDAEIGYFDSSSTRISLYKGLATGVKYPIPNDIKSVFAVVNATSTIATVIVDVETVIK